MANESQNTEKATIEELLAEEKECKVEHRNVRKAIENWWMVMEVSTDTVPSKLETFFDPLFQICNSN